MSSGLTVQRKPVKRQVLNSSTQSSLWSTIFSCLFRVAEDGTVLVTRPDVTMMSGVTTEMGPDGVFQVKLSDVFAAFC